MKDFIRKAKELLVPPGNGVFTVNTAKENKDKLHALLFAATSSVKDQWRETIDQLPHNESPCLLGICSDNGGGIQRGANWGPLFIRNEIYTSDPQVKNQLFDLGDIKVIPHLLHDKYLNEKTITHCQNTIYSESKELPVSPLSIAEFFLTDYYKNKPNTPVFALGGDHSVSYPLTKTYLRHKKQQGVKAAIIHFDAHTDLLTERLGIDLCFGSWCTHILDELDSPDLLIQLGIRSSGKSKEHWENTFGVKQYWAHEIQSQGVQSVVEQILNQLSQANVDELYISFDIDALDATIAGATGTPEPGGLTTDDCALIIHRLLEHYPLSGADLVEVAPFVSNPNLQGKVNPEPNSTLLAAGALSHIIIDHLNKYAHRKVSSP